MVAAPANKQASPPEKQTRAQSPAVAAPEAAVPEQASLSGLVQSGLTAGAPPAVPPPPRTVLHMQRVYGNHATRQLLNGQNEVQRSAAPAPVTPPRTRPNPFQMPAAPDQAHETDAEPAAAITGPVMGAASGGAPSPGTPAIQRGILDDAREALGGLDPTAIIEQARSILSGGDEQAEQSEHQAEGDAERMESEAQSSAEQNEQEVTRTDQAAQQDQAQAEQTAQQAQTQGEQGESQIGEAGSQGAQQIEQMESASHEALALETQLSGAGGGEAAGAQAGQAAQQAGQAAQQAGGGAEPAGAAAGAQQGIQAAVGQGVRQDVAADGLSCPEADILTTASNLGRDALNTLVRGADALTGGMASRVAGLARKVGQGLARGAQYIGQAVENVANAVKQRVTQMAQPLVNLVNQGVELATQKFNALRTRVSNAVQSVTQGVTRGIAWVRQNGPALIQRGISALRTGVGRAVERVAGMVGGAVRSVISSLPGGSAILSGIDRLRGKIGTAIANIRSKVESAIERGRAFGDRVLAGARALADRALQTVVQGARSARDLARTVVQGIGTAARTVYETVVPAPVRRLASQARQWIGQQVDRVRSAAGEVMKKIEGAVCVPLNEIAEPCIDQYLPFSEGQSEQSPNSTTTRGGTSSSITLSSSMAVTVPLAEFGIPGSAEVGRGASVTIRRSGQRAYSVGVSGESTVFYTLEASTPVTGSVTVDSPVGGDTARADSVWQQLTGGGAISPAGEGGTTGAGGPTAKAGIKAGQKRNIAIDYGFNVANSTCDLASMAGLLATYGLSGAVSAIVPQPFSTIVSAAGNAVAAGGWASHITGVNLTTSNVVEASAKASAPGQGQVSGQVGAESSTSIGLARQDDGSFRPEASFSQSLNGQLAGEMNLGGLFTAGGSVGASGSQSLTLIYDRRSGLITPSSLTTSISATLGLQGFNVSAFPAEFIPADAASIISQNLEVVRRTAARGTVSAQLSLVAGNIEALTNHVAQYLATAPIEQITWAGVMRKVREGMQQVTFDRRLTVTATEIRRAGISGEAEVNVEGTAIGVQGSVSAERRVVHTLYSNTTRMSGPLLNPPAPTPVIPPPTPTPDHPEPVHPVPDRPTPTPPPGPGPGPQPTPPPSRKNPLDMSADEFEADEEAQNELFEMAHATRARQNGFAQSMIAQAGAEGTASSILKRDDFDQFVEGVLEKVRRKGYSRIGEMPDIVRGRFNMARMRDVNLVVGEIVAQTRFRVIEVVAPREREGVAMGYPRWHIVVEDSNRIIHEWQIGTQAVTDVYEQRGINIPPEVGPLPEGMHNDIHDIEYDILKRIQEDHPDIAGEVGIPEFRRQVALASADAGRQGADMPDKNERIVELHNQCSTILRQLVDRHGPDIIRKYFKRGSSGGPEEVR